MLTLSGKAIETTILKTELFSLCTSCDIPLVLRKGKALLLKKGSKISEGFSHYLVPADFSDELPEGATYSKLGGEFDYLGKNDVVKISPDCRVNILFRAESNHNGILLTEQCNNYCLMCSQPPKKHDDSWILDEVRELIPMIPRDTLSLGITGGEPTLFGDGFLDVIRLCKSWLPQTALHVLSNGRTFSNIEFSKKYAAIAHPDLMVGIPVYSDDPTRHDYVVQARGAFDETIRGILNLKRLGQKVEIRVVIHKQTYERLPELAEFIARNLLFVDRVALMGLEMMGFTRANLDSLWIDPIEYKDQLSDAVEILRAYKIPVSVYNHQLCLVNRNVDSVYVKSISDWKNEYVPECEECSRKAECGGFFSSGVKFGYSQHIKAF
jgi:His-Xaa-Ser system radical SAM maturase HxsC